MKQKMLILGAVFFGILAAFLTWSQINAERQRIRERMEDNIYVAAAQTIPTGVKIEERMLKTVKETRLVGSARAQNDVEARHLTELIGRTLRVEVKEGQIISWPDVDRGHVGSRKFSESMPVSGNMRAVTVSVDAVSSVAGLIRPQDNVDIIGTFRFPDMKGDQSLETITLTVLQNVRVLATGSDYGATYASSNRSYNTLTLALTPTEAELIIFASQKGRLSFTLRSPQETKANTNLKNINWPYLQEHIKDFARERETISRSYR